jgi:hypothetical protein
MWQFIAYCRNAKEAVTYKNHFFHLIYRTIVNTSLHWYSTWNFYLLLNFWSENFHLKN